MDTEIVLVHVEFEDADFGREWAKQELNVTEYEPLSEVDDWRGAIERSGYDIPDEVRELIEFMEEEDANWDLEWDGRVLDFRVGEAGADNPDCQVKTAVALALLVHAVETVPQTCGYAYVMDETNERFMDLPAQVRLRGEDAEVAQEDLEYEQVEAVRARLSDSPQLWLFEDDMDFEDVEDEY